LKSFSYLYELSGAHKLFRRFLFFSLAIFDCNFAKNMAPSSEENEKYVAHLNEQHILKKVLKTASKAHRRTE